MWVLPVVTERDDDGGGHGRGRGELSFVPENLNFFGGTRSLFN